MSWDQQPFSFGTPNAQPPTPTKTPTPSQFPSPSFQTPRNNTILESRGGWTPTFAEEFSVFNATPGRLTSDPHHSFVETTPRPQNRPRSGDLSAEVPSHVNQFSDSSAIPASIEPTDQPEPSPLPFSTSKNRVDDSTSDLTPVKPRKRLEDAFTGQTATPPQSRLKGARKGTAKLVTKMQNDSQDGHYGLETPTQNVDFSSFPATSGDIFGYPMSVPATAPVFTNTKPFWDPDSSMTGMDLDFSADDVGTFSSGSQRISTSFDWGRSNQLFQDNLNLSQSQEPQQPAKRQRPLAPKSSQRSADLAISPLPPFGFKERDSNLASEDPFANTDMRGGVDPGLLFSRHTSNMSSDFEDVGLPNSRSVVREPYQHQLRESRRDQEELRSARRRRENARFERGTASSPVKGSARPGLQRSVSDNRGRLGSGRSMPRTGRSSPIKHQRPSSLTMIPESAHSQPRTEVIFTIDSNGKARTETVIVEEPKIKELPQSSISEEWDSQDSGSSSDDDDPIILPSQNNSFSLPAQSKGPKLARFATSSRRADVRESRSRLGSYSHSESSSQRSLPLHDGMESEAETVMEEDDGSGDATQELRRVMQSRKTQKLQRNPRHHRYASDPRSGSFYSSSTNISPTTVTDPDGGATPSSSRSGTTRCVCGHNDGDGFMIQCESCDNWLHGQCVNIDRRSLPAVYICAFCAQTPNMRGGRIREQIRDQPRGNHLSSPLAHKSFKSFR